MCPITAQATYEGLGLFDTTDWYLAGSLQDVDEATGDAVISAADDDSAMDAELRAHLLRICGLRGED
jgi:hypothetical protein